MCAMRGVKEHLGIDASSSAVALSRLNARQNAGEASFRFIHGGVDALGGVPASSKDAAILFNIADNLFPKDSEALMSHIRRIVNPGGRALVKLNPYITGEQIREWGVRVIDGDFLDDVFTYGTEPRRNGAVN